MADYDLKSITPSATVTDGTTIVFGAEGQTATPQPYTTAAIKAWIKSWIAKADVGLGNVANSLQLVAASNLSDLGNQVTARQNLGVSPPVMPVYGDANTYLTMPFTSAAGAALTANRLYVCPIVVPESRAFTKMIIECTTGVASALARVGVYNANQSTRQPGTLIAEAVSDGSSYPLDLSSTGLKTCTISQTLAPGLYYLVLASSSTASVMMANGAPNFLGAVMIGSSECFAARGGFAAATFGPLSGIASGDLSGTTFTWDSGSIPVIGAK